MVPGKVSCLMATYGRWSKVCRSLACYLTQDYKNVELVILNAHPEPLLYPELLLDHHSTQHAVRIVNETGFRTLGEQRNRLLEFADGEFCRVWDDDDLYLPWLIGQGINRIGNADVWRPRHSWWTPDGGKTFTLMHNTNEPSMLLRTDAVRRVGGFDPDRHTGEFAPIIKNLKIKETEEEFWSPFVYWWGEGWHVSGKQSNSGMEALAHAKEWRAAHHTTDVRPGERLFPDFAGMTRVWRQLAPFIPAADRSIWEERSLMHVYAAA